MMANRSSIATALKIRQADDQAKFFNLYIRVKESNFNAKDVVNFQEKYHSHII